MGNDTSRRWLGELLYQLLEDADPRGVRHYSETALTDVACDLLSERQAEELIREKVDISRSAEKEPGSDLGSFPVLSMYAEAAKKLLKGDTLYAEAVLTTARGEDPSDVFTLTVQRHAPGLPTLHQARMKAEDELHRMKKIVWGWLNEATLPESETCPSDLAEELTRQGYDQRSVR